MESAIACIDAGDNAGALPYLRAALAAMAALPDSGHAGANMTWHRESIRELITECKRAASTLTGLVSEPLEPKETGT